MRKNLNGKNIGVSSWQNKVKLIEVLPPIFTVCFILKDSFLWIQVNTLSTGEVRGPTETLNHLSEYSYLVAGLSKYLNANGSSDVYDITDIADKAVLHGG
jgi:hypothetical protein